MSQRNVPLVFLTQKPSIGDLYRKVNYLYNVFLSNNVIDNTQYLIWRSLNGSGNNIQNPEWGSTNIALIRKSAEDYEDGISELAVRGPLNPNPRVISDAVCKQIIAEGNDDGLKDMVWGWGQFLSHEIAITPDLEDEFANIQTPPDDEFPNRTITFKRSVFIEGEPDSPRQNPNGLSAYIDASNVYGTNGDRLSFLRMNDGSGKLKTTLSEDGEVLLPYNTADLPNANAKKAPVDNLFIAGDVRVNENVILTCMHTLWLREHNRLCDEIVFKKPDWEGQGELIFQQAKRMVTGFMQKITYDDFLPTLFGEPFPKYDGYKPTTNPGVTTEFATVGFRLGHTLVTSKAQIGEDPEDYLLLKDTFFRPDYIKENGVDELLLGSVLKDCNAVDTQIIDALRNSLFGPPTRSHLLDLAAINIQRGRGRGVPDYNTVRDAYGLDRVDNFDEITSSERIRNALEELYGSVDYIDPWIGMLAEDHIEGSPVGQLLKTIITDQFRRIRDGDRFWYQINPAIDNLTRQIIENTTLKDIILRNTSIPASKITSNVFSD